MNGDTGNDWSQWYSSADRARGSTQSTESRLSNGPNPSLFQPPRNQPAHSNSGQRLINKNLETSAREFIAGLKRANAASVHREQSRFKVDSSKEALEKSVWDQFLHSDQQNLSTPQSSSVSTISKLLGKKTSMARKPSESVAVRASESPSKLVKSQRPENARTSPFWKKLAEPVEPVESMKSTELAEPERESSYERQCHFLEGGVTVTGKGLSKKEKKSIRKELAPDKKKLLKEIRGEDPKPRAKPRRKKEPVRYRWCFDVHIKGLVRRSRVLEGAALQAFQTQFL
ncbi:hypothetical protein WA577_001683, partial [Blastocystis sp. JDR]